MRRATASAFPVLIEAPDVHFRAETGKRRDGDLPYGVCPLVLAAQGISPELRCPAKVATHVGTRVTNSETDPVSVRSVSRRAVDNAVVVERGLPRRQVERHGVDSLDDVKTLIA